MNALLTPPVSYRIEAEPYGGWTGVQIAPFNLLPMLGKCLRTQYADCEVLKLPLTAPSRVSLKDHSPTYQHLVKIEVSDRKFSSKRDGPARLDGLGEA
jgi:hypothetical protein